MCLNQIPTYTILELSSNNFQIEKYDFIKGERVQIDGTYFTREEAQLECNRLNDEASVPNT